MSWELASHRLGQTELLSFANALILDTTAETQATVDGSAHGLEVLFERAGRPDSTVTIRTRLGEASFRALARGRGQGLPEACPWPCEVPAGGQLRFPVVAS